MSAIGHLARATQALRQLGHEATPTKAPSLLGAGVRRFLFDAVDTLRDQFGADVTGTTVTTTFNPVTGKTRYVVEFELSPNELLWPKKFTEAE